MRPVRCVTDRPLSPPQAGGILMAGGASPRRRARTGCRAPERGAIPARRGYGAVTQQGMTTGAMPVHLATANDLQRKWLGTQGHSVVPVAPHVAGKGHSNADGAVPV